MFTKLFCFCDIFWVVKIATVIWPHVFFFASFATELGIMNQSGYIAISDILPLEALLQSLFMCL